MRRQDLGDLKPGFRAGIEWLETRCRIEGVHVVRFETYRSRDRQDRLFESGRSRARAGESPHNFGLAVDFVLDVDRVPVQRRAWRDKMPLDAWDRSTPAAAAMWRRFGDIVESTGLVWGGRWRHPNGAAIDEYGFGWDLPHVEAPEWRKGNYYV